MLCNSDGGTTIGYDSRHHTVNAVRVNDPEEDAVFYEFSEHFQQGVIDIVPNLCQIIETHGLTSIELRANALCLMERLAFQPEEEIAKFFFRLNHNEIFGTGAFEKPQVAFPWVYLFKALIGKKHRDAFVEKMQTSRWAQGMLTVTGHFLLRSIYNRRVLHYPNNQSPWSKQ